MDPALQWIHPRIATFRLSETKLYQCDVQILFFFGFEFLSETCSLEKNQLVIFHSSDFRQLILLNTGLEIPDVHAHKSSVEDCTGTGAIEQHSDCKGFLPCRTWCVPVQVRRTFAQCFAQCPSCCQRTPKLLLGPCEMREASEDPNFYQECL